MTEFFQVLAPFQLRYKSPTAAMVENDLTLDEYCSLLTSQMNSNPENIENFPELKLTPQDLLECETCNAKVSLITTVNYRL